MTRCRKCCPRILLLLFSLCLTAEIVNSFSTRSTFKADIALRRTLGDLTVDQHGWNHRVTSSLGVQDGDTNGFPEVERPEPSVLLSAQDDSMQKAGIAAIGVGLLGGTFLIENLLNSVQQVLPFFDTILDFTVPLPLGLVFAALGATHFFYKDEYAAIVPPNGAWGGLWNIPAPGAKELGLTDAEYHVIWTGLAEIGGGLLLVLGGLNAVPIQIPAFLLFLLTLAVTPANVYMFTHDAQMSFAPPVPYPLGHVGRGVLQCIFLSLFWHFAFQS